MLRLDPDEPDAVALLPSGGDSRLDLSGDPRANKYGCRYEPEAGLLAMGSCTGSTISRRAFDAVLEAEASIPRAPADRAAWSEQTCASIRRRLTAHLLTARAGTVDVLLTPSGTDAEYIPLILSGAAAGRRVTNIVVAPAEVGSGTSLAAAGEHFDGRRPHSSRGSTVEPFSGCPIVLVAVPVREADGTVRGADEIDTTITDTVAAAFADSDEVIVHVVAHSKTGVHAPTLSTIGGLQRRYGSRLHVVIDAAQGRISRRGMRASLASQHIVILTGSKFYGGPPFSGCVFVPDRYRSTIREAAMPDRSLSEYFAACEAPDDLHTWRASVNPDPNIGLVLRWLAALTEIDDYYETPPPIRYRTLRAFERRGAARLAASPAVVLEDSVVPEGDSGQRLLESKRTVFSFGLVGPDGHGLDADRLRRVRGALRDGSSIPPNDRDIKAIETGQPVVLTTDGDAVLRIALGAQLVRRWSRQPDIEAAIDADVAVAIDALERATDRSLGEVGTDHG